MSYINRLFKFFLLLVILVLFCYTGLWFYSSHMIKQRLDSYSEGNFKLSYSKINMNGFPFKIKANIDDLNVYLKSEKPSFESTTTYEKVTVETDLRFSNLKITILGKSTSDGLFDNKSKALDSIYKDPCYINITARDNINTQRVIRALYNEEVLNEIKLSKVSFIADNVTSIDRSTQKEISTSSTNIQFVFDSPSANVVNSHITLDSKSNITPEGKELFIDLLNYPFSTLSINADIASSSDKNKAMPSVNIKSLNFEIDKTLFSFAGNVENNDQEKTIFNINFKANEWNSFFKTLVNEDILSTKDHDIIIKLITYITGENYSENNIDLKLTNEGDTITISEKPLYAIVGEFNKIMKSSK